ncbi:ornithine cyclodeaminase family protein [Pseudaminobacter soli (ex Li et al. 2025)]|uniref:ornithine cyclodeaminase family protein n=1 Tax=Pseudaminobacter soli (ex Li et al. 2025) TaxID=1295366 RepID=UPI0024781AB1|nr:ornithine cyclodeaminase family protein [Mesorhizobium soli]
MAEMEAGFATYSRGLVDVPPVGELLFPEVRGEMHVKYGAVRGDGVFVVKIATGFYGNPEKGLPSSNGAVLVFSARDGSPIAILLDEGHLTDIRTAAAGAVVAKYLAPQRLDWIGICGSGTQARLQARYLASVTRCRNVLVWARNPERAAECASDIVRLGFEVALATSAAALAERCRLIVTTTASHEPFLMAHDIRPGTHITAMGADTPEKTELDPALLGGAAIVVADSRAQCIERGEIHHALARGEIRADAVVEIGELVDGRRFERRPEDITIADLTGVAVQDIVLARAICRRVGLIDNRLG